MNMIYHVKNMNYSRFLLRMIWLLFTIMQQIRN